MNNEPPVLEMPPNQNFMIVNGETFFLEKAPVKGEDLLRHVKSFYEDNLADLKDRVARHVSQEAFTDLDAQISRIERHLQSGIVALPDGLSTTGSVMMLYANKVYETRVMLFRPTRISCTLGRVSDWVNWIGTYVQSRERERFSKFVEWANGMISHYNGLTPRRDLHSVKVDIKVEQDLIIEAMIASFIPEIEKIHVRPLNVHPHTYSDGALCTGTSRASTFWEDPRFKENFNSLNPHSFANSSTTAVSVHRSLLRNQYFIEATIRENEGGAWRVS